MSKKTKVDELVVAASSTKKIRAFGGTKQPDAPELELARIRSHTHAQFIDSLFGSIRTLIRSGAFAFVAYCMYLTIVPSVGKQTTIRIAVDWIVRLGADQWIYYIVVFLFGIGYYHQRGLRRRTTKEQGDYIRQLETRIDPQRTSSGLTETGELRKEDKDAI